MKAAFLQFLQQEMAIPATYLQLVQRHQPTEAHLIPMLLWQYGLINLSQVEHILDWLEGSEEKVFSSHFNTQLSTS